MAFCSILSSYIFFAKQLSLINRAQYMAGSEQEAAIMKNITSLEGHIAKSFENSLQILNRAKMDIILTRSEVDCHRVQAVDMHFLATSFLHNIQESVQQSDTPTLDIGEIMRIYGRSLSDLRREASRRPRRRVFGDIQNFQQEISALKSVAEMQAEVAENYVHLLYPGSFRVTDVARMDQYGAEYDIWDEDHGRAIRVFTGVTLFLLPLSFVSSFMGMNTTDVRDTGYDQRLFWAVAVPVTTCVIALAFIFSYKSEEVVDWLQPMLLWCAKCLESAGAMKDPKDRKVSTSRSLVTFPTRRSEGPRPITNRDREVTWRSQASS
ncbi:uncharacterized protein DNG_05847 [Cephalotrichum gorgonifer]|uniref:Uncharacterized protein n=1 Tax=Cephalotrichum gorgonifer TaxID=2041049 RepID=A0AAE8SVV0_9PEZI|nr:uncharacterized protein DNG_05847 [Cephalotrichum gorgonifer]